MSETTDARAVQGRIPDSLAFTATEIESRLSILHAACLARDNGSVNLADDDVTNVLAEILAKHRRFAQDLENALRT